MQNGGRLTIYTRKEEDSDCIEVDFQDTGHGIPAAAIKDVFTPFFTTKETGEGTGLGLYLSHSILKRENGDITVKSEEGVGSIFTVYLPVANKQ
jgi:signal transduction histidine kinase